MVSAWEKKLCDKFAPNWYEDRPSTAKARRCLTKLVALSHLVRISGTETQHAEALSMLKLLLKSFMRTAQYVLSEFST